MSPSFQVRIQGREYTLRSHETQEQIQRVVDFVEEKLAETAQGRRVDTRDLTVLALLNLAGLYLQLLDEKEAGFEQRHRLQQLAERLEQFTSHNSGC